MRALLAAFALLFSLDALAAGAPTRVGTPPRADAPDADAEAPRKVATAPKQGAKQGAKKGTKKAGVAPKVGKAAPVQVAPKGGAVPAGPRVAGPKSGVPVAGGPKLGGPKPGGPKLGGPVAGGPVVRGPQAGGPVVRGPALGGPAVRGPAVTGNPVVGAPVRHGGPRHVVAGAVSPLHGIFIYGPRPGTHNTYTGQNEKIARRDMPDRSLDRGGSLAVGMLGGALFSSEADGSAVFGDPGAGLQARFRPVEFLGLQVAGQHSVGWMGVEPGAPLRESTLGTASLQLFAFPWSHVSPFLTAGATMQDTDMTLIGASDGDDAKTLWGPHAGLGLEIGIGKSVAIDLDGRLNYLVNAKANGATPTAFTTNLGLMFHF